MVTKQGKELHWDTELQHAHLHSHSELDLIENKGDEVPTAHSPTCHQLATQVQDCHLQQHARDLEREHREGGSE